MSSHNQFAALSALDPDEPVAGAEAKVRQKDERHSGFTGLLNQGATCYLNSLLQSLYMTPEFRRGLFALTPDDLLAPSKEAKAEAKQLAAAAAAGAGGRDKSPQPAKGAAAPNPAPSASPAKPPQSAAAAAAVGSGSGSGSDAKAAPAAGGSASGSGASLSDTAARVRVVPFELQRLFGRLQTSRLSAVSTSQLTTAFKWDSRDVYQQHDVSELNRILIDAIEKSLSHTRASALIPSLYKGLFVQEVECMVCRNVTSREEAFYDLSVDVAGYPSLIQSLDAFTAKEHLTGDNQYNCAKCKKKVDAQKGVRLVTLPPILTFSLKRFRFDWAKDTREKITDSMSFPTRTLDLSSYLKPRSADGAGAGAGDGKTASASTAASASAEYELNAVIIHRGTGAGAGHYFAYIRDSMREGNWDGGRAKGGSGGGGGGALAEETISRGRTRGRGKTPGATWNYANPDANDPAVRDVREVLLSQPHMTMAVDALGGAFSALHGKAWRKVYYNDYRGLPEFLSRRPDVFFLSDGEQMVTLLAGPETEQQIASRKAKAAKGAGKGAKAAAAAAEANAEDADLAAATAASLAEAEKAKAKTQAQADADATAAAVAAANAVADGDAAAAEAKRIADEADAKEKADDEAEWRWFNFNDEDVTPIHAGALEAQFGGKKASETAYMLVYRRKQVDANGKAVRPTAPALPQHIKQSIDDARRAKEDALRAEEELKHRITLLFSVFEFGSGKASAKPAAAASAGSDAKAAAATAAGSAPPPYSLTHYRLTTHDNATVQTLLQEIRSELPQQPAADTRLEVLLVKGKNQVTVVNCADESTTLDALGIKTGNELMVELVPAAAAAASAQPRLTAALAVDEFRRRADLQRVYVANCSSGCAPDAAPRTYPFLVALDTTSVVELKVSVLSVLPAADKARADRFGGGRLKAAGGLLTDESKPLSECKVKNGNVLSFECDQLPAAGQIAVRVAPCADGKDIDKALAKEFIFALKDSVAECKKTIACAFGVDVEHVRVRKMGKFGKAGAVVFDEHEPLSELEIVSNDLLLMETKPVRPPGHMLLRCYVQLPPQPLPTDGKPAPPPSKPPGSSAALDVKGDVKAADAKAAPAAAAAGAGAGAAAGAAAAATAEPPAHPFPYFEIDFDGLVHLPEMTVHENLTLAQLKVQLASTPLLSAYVAEPTHIRISAFRAGGQPGRILREPEKPLKGQGLSDENDLYLEILSAPDVLPPNTTLFYVTRRRAVRNGAGEVVRSYTPLTALSIRKAEVKQMSDLKWKLTAAVADVPVESMVLGFWVPNEHAWKVLRPSQSKKRGTNKKSRRAAKTKSKSGKATGVTHFDSLGDRVVIAVKDKLDDPADTDDFATPHDRYYAKLRSSSSSSSSSAAGAAGGSAKKRGDAAQLRIEVEEFSGDEDSGDDE